ncbi:MAG: hypothetical protein L6Q57_03115 [Alphaproteobacteria bacterium]|nr:hypothetical protein [Alphaproteobacteria bacterium]
MTATDWPETIYPVEQTFYIRTRTSSFISSLTGQVQARARKGSRWVAVLDFRLPKSKAAIMDALIAGLNGATGTLLVPDFRMTRVRFVTESMDYYAESVGLTFFNDEYDFDDMTQNGGFLCIEESVPLGLEENSLCGGVFDAFLFGDDGVFLLTEDGDEIWGENVGIPFLTERGEFLTLEEGEPLDIGMEEGFGLEAENGDDLLFQVGGRFFEGAGQPELVGGAWNRLSIDGLAPGIAGVVLAGEAIQTSPGRGHLVLFDVVTDANGYAQIQIAPHIREAIDRQDLKTGGIKVAMRLIDNDAGRNETKPPMTSTYQLRLEEVLP